MSNKMLNYKHRGNYVTLVGINMFLGFCLTGCSDHRISLAEFLQIQQEIESAKATTQPADVQMEICTLVDSHLEPYKVGPSDVLNILLTRLDQEAPFPPVQVRVDRNGEIDLPVVGKIKVTNMELEDVEDAIQTAYIPKVYRDASVHVTLIEPKTTEVLVTGAATLPGLVQLNRTDRDLLHAIVGAGGISQMASGTITLRRLREPGVEVTFDLTDPEELKKALAQKPLENGDIVNVHAATPNMIFVGGLVNAPQPQVYPPGTNITILQALAASAGLRTDVFPKEATLIRRMPDGQEVHVKLDLDRITQSKDPNITLAAGDILWVPDTIETRVQDWINRNIFIRGGFSANVNYNVRGIEFMNRQDQQSRVNAGGGGLQDTFDPYGFLLRNAALLP